MIATLTKLQRGLPPKKMEWDNDNLGYNYTEVTHAIYFHIFVIIDYLKPFVDFELINIMGESFFSEWNFVILFP